MGSQYVIDPPERITLPVIGDERRFVVNRVYCVGRNYADHAREMGHDPNREPPFFFMKPANSILADGKDFAYPNLSHDVQHEVEMVIAIGQGGANIAPEQALEHVYGYAVGLDMTRRDLQAEAKKMGRPWDTGKAFDQSAPCAAITPASQCGHLTHSAITLLVNGKQLQTGTLDQMIWNVPETIAYLSTLFTLEVGDLIFSGTPAGVGPIVKGDILEAAIDGLATLKTTVI
ncbi:fumarylpyruvate hydrolase [Polynucleobacter meluiroseus]|uniref:Fumarylpyruvate hydrolase n=2 Tax=Polynucleobacter meluiroseus TaxID=1938814 RepID=A0A240E3H5_9BURK|nr:fumarylacetoacetate hydrolase family protein [Polynucleobacter meluiroseus]SNX29474.1 fumarylpyruvate hydrolase [Polynucleobacter meluiroseus]